MEKEWQRHRRSHAFNLFDPKRPGLPRRELQRESEQCCGTGHQQLSWVNCRTDCYSSANFWSTGLERDNRVQRNTSSSAANALQDSVVVKSCELVRPFHDCPNGHFNSSKRSGSEDRTETILSGCLAVTGDRGTSSFPSPTIPSSRRCQLGKRPSLESARMGSCRSAPSALPARRPCWRVIGRSVATVAFPNFSPSLAEAHFPLSLPDDSRKLCRDG